MDGILVIEAGWGIELLGAGMLAKSNYRQDAGGHLIQNV